MITGSAAGSGGRRGWSVSIGLCIQGVGDAHGLELLQPLEVHFLLSFSRLDPLADEVDLSSPLDLGCVLHDVGLEGKGVDTGAFKDLVDRRMEVF